MDDHLALAPSLTSIWFIPLQAAVLVSDSTQAMLAPGHRKHDLLSTALGP